MMVRRSMKRKRGIDLTPPTTAAADGANEYDFITSPKYSSGPIRIGFESPQNIGVSRRIHTADVCSISDDVAPGKRQSSLLSFFTKEKKVKPLSKPKEANDNLVSGEGLKTKSSVSSLPLVASSSVSNPGQERISQRTPGTSSSVRGPSASQQNQQKKKKSLTQVYIDCGQKAFGQILCCKCGMLYVPGVLEDETEHKKMCKAYALGILCHRGTIKGGKKIDVMNGKDGATIVSWKPSVKKPKGKADGSGPNDDSCHNDRPSQWPLLATMISKDLGTHEETTLHHLSNEMVFLCIGKPPSKAKSSCQKCRILGVATVQLLGKKVPSYRMIGPNERSLTPCTNAKLGIGLLWTHPACRSKGIATKLVHMAREHSIFGMRVTKQDVAFSNPTQAGYNFALRYSGGNHSRDAGGNPTRGPLVYEMEL